MSDINLDFTVSNNSINFTVEPNDITITPTDIQLTLGASGGASPAGNVGELQYKVSGIQLGGVPNTLYDGSNLTLGNVANIKITGGVNGYVLQTDGSGNLNWVAQSGGGTGAPGGSNTQIQYNDNGLFGGNVGFTFNEVTGDVNVPGNLNIVGNISGNGSNISNINGSNVIGYVANATHANIADIANSAGNANYANYALYAGNITISSQPNITTLGTLLNLNVSGMTSIQEAKEKVVANASGAVSTVNFNVLDSAIVFQTGNALANFTLNIRGNSITTFDSISNVNESITITYICTNGSTAYYANVIQIDGTTITPQWVYPGLMASGTVNGKDVYTFNIIKTAANTYSTLASKIGFV